MLAFEPWLPLGLRLAAGAMLWMVFFELVPEAAAGAGDEAAAAIVALVMAGMLGVMLLLQ